MGLSLNPDRTRALQQLMEQAKITSLRALSQKAGVSSWQIQQLRKGQAEQMRVHQLFKLSEALQVSVLQLITEYGAQAQAQAPEPEAQSPKSEGSAEIAIAQLKQEYQRLQTQLAEQRAVLWQEFQQSSLQTLESWLLYWPTAAHAVQQDPQFPAVRLLPLVRPVEQLMKEWGVAAIAPVGAELPYDPRLHQPLQGNPQPGEAVRIRNTGYCQGEKVLHRAKVSPL